MPKKTPTILIFSIILLLASEPGWAQRQRVQVGPGSSGGGRTQVRSAPRQVSTPRPQTHVRSAPRVQSAPRVHVRQNAPQVRQPSQNRSRTVVNTRPQRDYRPNNGGSGRTVVNTRPQRDYRSNNGGNDRTVVNTRPQRNDRSNNNGRGRAIVNTQPQRDGRGGNEPFRYYNSGGGSRNASNSPNRNNNPGGRTRIVTGPGYTSGRVPITVPSRQPIVSNQPTQVINNNYYYSNNRRYAPRYTGWNSGWNNGWNDPYFYSNHNYRRGFRHYQPCAVPFLSLGFFAARPYSYYDYSRVSYAQPFLYGDDSYYRSAPLIENNAVASTNPTAPVQSLEQELLSEISRYVDSQSKNGQFQIADPAFGNQLWNLDLTEAPAVYSLDANHYTVVAGFEGNLGENAVPSAVGLEFFVVRENGLWKVKQGWIVSANGIPRAKRFQSPSYPQVQTWQEGALCPFTGQRMVPVTESSAQQG